MVEMRQPTTFLALILFLSSPCRGGEGAYEITVCMDLAAQLSYDFRRENGDVLPEKWEDFMGIRMLKDGKLDEDVGYMEAINSMSLVPGAPVIRADPRISQEFVGFGLLMISKENTSYDRLDGDGRYAILVGPKTENPNDRLFPTHFVPKISADAILAQIPEFDPTNQPLAFPDVESQANEIGKRKLRQKRETRELYENDLKNQIRAKLTTTGTGTDGGSATPPWLPWSAIPMAVLIFAACWWVFRKGKGAAKPGE